MSSSKLNLLNEEATHPITPLTFSPMRRAHIAPTLICPYKYACSTSTCECCGFRACDCSFHCPARCQCSRDFSRSFDMVNCTGVLLSAIPTYLPTSTTEIRLDGNNLKRVQPYQFFGRSRLRYIDLSHNQLAFVEEHSFHGLHQLRRLLLAHNHLQILLGHEFMDLPQLAELRLDHNRIQFISNSTFASLPSLQILSLQHNMLRHLMERPLFFQFNFNLANLTLDSSSSMSGQPTEPDNQIQLIESLTSGNVNKKAALLKAARLSNRTADQTLNNHTAKYD